ncbi:triacylglycerol lipase OBL1-like [Mercurialis annua]|uniref:triacylglycerol lipase OBL1-like n=1 Tax=Mercurialis annua TaxID=3986 RepID=UPI002160DA31|nr:triacylglycerol lipase OBL1-like [Mercurialis annua]
MAATTSIAPNFLIVDPKKGKKRDIFKYLVSNDVKSGMKFLESSEDDVKGGAAVDHRSILLVSIIIRRLMTFLETPLKLLGIIIEFILNFISQNGGFSGILNNFLRANVKIPKKGTENFLSTIGHLDGRIDLYKTTILSEKVDDSIAADVSNVKSELGIRSELGNRYLMDLCIMAAKLVYENEKVVQNVVERHWKMHFAAFYNCWNEQQKQSNTQVFICCDKPKDANLIVVSFRGTEPFNAQDWDTDFDFSWYEIPKVGKIHIGFLEALGLGNRENTATFHTHLQKKHSSFFHLFGDFENLVVQWARKSAYYAVSLKLKSLLKEHKNAKFVVTGHSLGGALAILYPSILVIQEETEMLQRLMNVYTFGQPRIGDVQLGNFIESYLNYPVTRYFRVVYCNDMVPRVPFDDKIFAFKHFGTCLYYDSRYFGQFMDEEPNPNFFNLTRIIPMRLNALWELVRSLLIRHTHGPDYEESWFCTLARAAGLLLPGISAHSPIDYVNSVRLGRERVTPTTSLKSFTRKM